jgi:endothelin-converting enzyme/putative endopeptidase
MDAAAIDAAGLAPIADELARINAVASPGDLQDVFKMLQLEGIDAPFAFSAATDPNDTNRRIAEISQAGLGLPNRDDYADDALRSAYQQHIAQMARLSGLNIDPAAVMRIESALASASLTRKQIRSDANATNHLTATADLSRIAPAIDWPKFGGDLRDVNLAEPAFLAEVNRLMTDVSLEEWRSYLRWQLVHHFAEWLPAPIAGEDRRFESRFTGVKEQPPRWRQCVAAVDQHLGEALGKEYVARRFSPATRARVNEMVDNIIAALREDFTTVGWMSDATRAEAIAKVDAVRRKIGYPDRWRDDSSMRVERRPFAANVRAAEQFEALRLLAQIGKPVDRDEWAMTPQTWNAYNNFQKNEIVFPAGILQWPRFDANLDDAFNYGSIGSVIGHELTHGFDDSGRQRDARGNVRDWWTPEDAKRFDERAACVIRQFADLGYDGKLVAGESIADLGGLVIAWSAWQRSLKGHPAPRSKEQQFFIAYAQARALNLTPELERRLKSSDTHPLSRDRVNAPLSNLPQFATAFQCRSGDPMVRAARCRVW